MKKILLSIFLLTLSTAGNSTETVKVSFPFTQIPDFQRHLIEKVNANQDRWNFVIVTKPGAGGAIAANDILHGNSSVLISNSSFFIRPNLPSSPYQVDQFRLLSVNCAVPMAVVSKKYKSFKDIKGSASIGITGIGSTTHIVALEIAKKYPDLIIVPYKGTNESLQGILSGEIDMAIQFVKPIESYIKLGQINALGLTGNKTYLNIPLLSNLGFNNTNLITNNFFLSVSKNIPKELYNEWRQLFSSIDNQEQYNNEMCTPINETSDWFAEQQSFWKNISSTIRLTE
jgi:tripartite-type tricarboxylate transporter receptor subunit TctC